MAISVEDTYPGRSVPASAAYPEGAIQNETVPNSSDDGTPLDDLWGNDLEGLRQAIMRSASIVPTAPGNIPDTATASQILQGLIELVQGRATYYDDSGIADAYVLDVQTNQQAPASLFDGQIFEFIAGNTNTGLSTVNPAGFGNKNIINSTVAGAITTGERVKIQYRLATDNFRIISLKQATSSIPGIVEIATNSEVATGTDTSRVPSVSSMGSHQGVAKAWVNFNGEGVVAIRDSFNVSSITDFGIGNYRANFATSMPNNDYAVSLTCDGTSAGNVMVITSTLASNTTALCFINIFDLSTARDRAGISATIFGD